MKLGIDFGTTRTTVAIVDRGNYPVVFFEDADGDQADHIPTMVALVDNDLVYGFEAHDAAIAGYPHIRSFKRCLASAHMSATTLVSIGDRQFPMLRILAGYFAYVAELIRHRSSFSPLAADEPLEAVIGVPAHSHSAQRFLTLDGALHGGITPLLLLNEPSAAGLEYTHRHASTLNSKRTRVLVYDLGGGTFDASLVAASDGNHEVISSHGNNALGGDDFDDALAQTLLTAAELSKEDISTSQWARFMHDVRLAKEGLLPQSRWISVASPVDPLINITIPVTDFYEAVEGLVAATMDTMMPLLSIEDNEPTLNEDVAGIYVVGGASELPVIARLLRQTFARRVRRSPHSGASTAIGLAIAADPDITYTLTERLSRGLGVFREMDSGDMVSFDAILPLDMALHVDSDGLTTVTRTYKAAHNIGVFRFAEYSALDESGIPRGQVAPLETVYFPFDASLRSREHHELREIPVRRVEGGPMMQEAYTVDAHGIVWVTMTDLGTGYSQTYSLAKNGMKS